jgi:hypothetical protein
MPRILKEHPEIEKEASLSILGFDSKVAVLSEYERALFPKSPYSPSTSGNFWLKRSSSERTATLNKFGNKAQYEILTLRSYNMHKTFLPSIVHLP